MGGILKPSINLPGSKNVWDYKKSMGRLLKEHVRVLGLSANNDLVIDELISIGTLTASLIHPREMMRPLIATPCARFIMIHNHPSGDPKPSPEDKEVTKRMRNVGGMMGIPLVDHVIIAKKSYYSFSDSGEIKA